MIRPTQRAVVLAACGLLFALVPLWLGSSFWSLYLVYLIAFGSLLALDLLRAPAPPRVPVQWTLPPMLYIGASDPLSITIDAPRLQVTLLIDAGDEISPMKSLAASVVGATTIDIPLTPLRRGSVEIATLWLSWRGPLGLLERITKRSIGESIPILPNVRAVRTAALALFRQNALMAGLRTERYLGDGSEFDALREFSPGLDHRTIDWKASARHRKLLNRQFRAERNHQVIVAVDTGHLMREPVDGIPKLDHAINAGLLLSYVCLRGGDRVGMYGFAARPGAYAAPTSGVGSIQRLQHMAARLDYSPDETNFTLGLAELSSRVRRRSLIVLMTDFTDTVTAELLLDNIGRLSQKHLVVFVCLRDPLLYSGHARDPETILDVHEAVVTRDIVRDRDLVIRKLRRLGVRCIDTEPKRFSAELLSTYLEIRQRELVG